MNRSILGVALGAMLVCNMSVFAQTSKSLGVSAGIGDFKQLVNGSTPSDQQSIQSFVAGGFFEGNLCPYFSMETGINYSTRGIKEDAGTLNVRLSYLALPVHFKAKFHVLPGVTPYVLGGPNVGYLVRAWVSSSTAGVSGTGNISSNYNQIDFGIDGGAGAEFNVASWVVPFVELTYYGGINHALADLPDNKAVRNDGFEVRGGIKFPM